MKNDLTENKDTKDLQEKAFEDLDKNTRLKIVRLEKTHWKKEFTKKLAVKLIQIAIPLSQLIIEVSGASAGEPEDKDHTKNIPTFGQNPIVRNLSAEEIQKPTTVITQPK